MTLDVIPIRLEPVAPQHTSAIQVLADDPLVSADTMIPHPYPHNGAAQFVAEALEGRRMGTLHAFAILVGADTLVGICRLEGDLSPGGTAELGYWLGTAYWGKGIATHAGRWMLAYAFDTLRLGKVVAWVVERNHASQNVVRKLGLRLMYARNARNPKWSGLKFGYWRLTRAEYGAMSHER